MNDGNPRMAIAHEWLSSRAGSEKTFHAMAEAFPHADLYALTEQPGLGFDWAGRPVTTTFLDRWGYSRERRELTIPLMPLAWRTIRTRAAYDSVLTSSHAFVRWFPPARTAEHFCYVHAPLRYAWTPELDQRTARRPPGFRTATRVLRRLDSATVDRVDHFAANSSAVRRRIQRFYDRDAVVIHPPVDVGFFTPDPGVERERRALAFSRFIPYKRLDLAIEACALAGVPLTVAGSGGDERRLRELAGRTGGDVRFEISPSDERLRELYRSSVALVFPANEDFGIVPVEAQACGTPVVGFDEGGVRDTVDHGRTGLRVGRQSAAELGEAVRAVLERPPAPDACRRNAERFSRPRFIREIREWVLRRD